MSFFISDALAQAAPQQAQQGEPISFFVTLGLMVVVFYFLLVRPQAKRAKEHKKMVESLAKGDEVVTMGGLYGKVTELGENHVEVELADNFKVKVQRQAVSSVVPKGTIKNLS